MTREGRDDGSVLLLTLGYALLALVAILICVDATSLYLAQKRLDSLADAAALAGADGFALSQDGDGAFAGLDESAVHEQAQAIVSAAGGGAALVSADTPGGNSARVTVTARWVPPVVALFVPDGVRLESTATTRSALG